MPAVRAAAYRSASQTPYDVAMSRHRWTIAVVPLIVLAQASAIAAAPAADPVRVGPQPGGGSVVATRQLLRPAGDLLEPASRLFDLALAPDGKTLWLKGDWSLVAVDTAGWTVRARYWFGEAGSPHGIAVTADGGTVYATLSGNEIVEAGFDAKGELMQRRSIQVKGPGGKGAAGPAGIALASGGRTAWVALSLNNTLARVDLAAGKVVREIPVGVAPYAVALSPDGRTAWVSNEGGRRPGKAARTAESAGTKIAVDRRGIALGGTVSVVDLVRGRELAQVETGLHPTGLALSSDGRRLYVACAHADRVDVINTSTRRVTATIPVKPDPGLPYGSAPNALALSPDGATLYVACGGNNAVAVVAVSGEPRVLGYIPVGWYPGGVATDGVNVYTLSVKGLGSRDPDARAKEKTKTGKDAWHVWWQQAAVHRVPLPSATVLDGYTARVREDGRVPQMLAALERSSATVPAVPVPARLGDPSVFEHVVYIVKENRTYDQVLGDMGKGNGDPKLCIYGREITPNHHALADEFVLLDNYYCNGVASCDGHAWATEANTSAYVEKAFGSWRRAYDFGRDPLAFSPTGFIWDAILAKGLSFRNYGEFDFPKLVPGNSRWTDFWAARKSGAKTPTFAQFIPIENLRGYTAPEYPGWEMQIPDMVRADAFLREFAAAEAKGEWPNLILIYLPQDHTNGTAPELPTPRAHLADNDLALGRIVEAISKSRFWPKTVIFVNEDDPQDGFDHVDGHRSLCLVVSPYSRSGRVVSEFYNQTSVIHTMNRILGLPPLTQFDAMAPLMTACFGPVADLAPYRCRDANIALDELNPPKAALTPEMRKWASLSERLNLAIPDAIDDDVMNRILWADARPGEPYPAAYAGAHGKGLKALRLQLDPEAEEDDD